MKSALILALAAVCASPANDLQQPGTSPADDLERLMELTGTWRGELGYLDYQSGEWSAIPMDVDSEPSLDGAFLLSKVAFGEPGWTLHALNVHTVDQETGEYVLVNFGRRGVENARHDVTQRYLGGPGTWSMIFAYEGLDDGRQAEIRETYSLDGDAYSQRKEVRFEGGEWFTRNEVKLNRHQPKLDPAKLVGTWKVDLRPAPDADAYFTELVIEEAGDGALKGSFYGTDLERGRVNDSWDALHLAFVTEDGSGAYNTSAMLDGDVLRGTTHSLGRDFLSCWTAVRAD
ncbi:MAG: hypothetical protein AAF682_30685 [Planctomycetota bacterium]